MEKRSEYDTDPLDPGYVRETDEIMGATREIGRTPHEQARQSEIAEDPTRRLADSPSTSYPSIFVPPTYQPPPVPMAGPAPAVAPRPSHRVQRLGLSENIASALPYIPFLIGGIIALVELFLLPRSEVRTRFHAAQALAMHAILLAAGAVFRLAQLIAGIALGGSFMLGFIWWLLYIAAVIFLIISAVRVWQGEDARYPQVADLANWFNRVIEPQR